MKTKLLILTFLSVFISSALNALPSKINYQGLITNADGSPIVSATNTITINLYTGLTGGSQVYTETFTSVESDTNGIYSIQIGDSNLQSELEDNANLWLELVINGDTLSPRQQINAVPYALVAKAAESIVPGSDADSLITSLLASEAARPSQVPVLLAIRWNYPSLNSVFVQYWDYAEGQSKLPEVGDRILITEQSSASENGIYEVESLSGNLASLVRAEDYNSAEEINAGDFVFVQEGDLAGQGYVLGALSESFELGVNDLNFSRFTIDKTQNVSFDQGVEARMLMVNGGLISFDGHDNEIRGNLYVDGYRADFMGVEELNVPTPDQNNEATNKSYVDSLVATNTAAVSSEISARTTAIAALQADVDQNESDADTAIAAETAARTSALESLQAAVSQAEADALNTLSSEIANRMNSIAALQSDVDQNESDADAAISSLQVSVASSAKQFVADFGFSDNQSNLASIYLDLYNPETGGVYSCEVGDLVLLTGQTILSQNGIYEITSSSSGAYSKYITLARPSNYDTSEEVNEGDFALVEKGSLSGLAFMLGTLPDTFELGVDNLNWYRCGINTAADINFQGTVTFSEIRNSPAFGTAEFRLGEWDNYFRMDMGARFDFKGYDGSVRFRDGIEVDFENSGGVDFDTDVEFNSTVTVQEPTQDNQAANKSYVDTQVATNTSSISSETTNRTSAIVSLQSDVDQNESDADAAIAALVADVDQNESDADAAIAALVADVDQNESDADAAIVALVADVDQNESDADAAISELQSIVTLLQNSAAKSPVQYVYDWHQANLNNVSWWDAEIGDRALLTAQSPSSENGIYEVISKSGNYVALVRASDFDSEDEINAGAFVFVQDGHMAGQGYILGYISDNFQLGNESLSFSKFTLDTSEDVQFERTVQAREFMSDGSGGVDFRLGPYENSFSLNSPWSEFLIEGNSGMVQFREQIDVVFSNSGGVDFDTDVEFNSTVTVQDPSQDNQAANKSYVDSVAVPPGGLIAWPSDQPIPEGYSNGHLTHEGMQYPAVDFIWILKD